MTAGLSHKRQRIPARALARKFHKPELRHLSHGAFGYIFFKRFFQFRNDSGAVAGVGHIDEIDDYDTAYVSQLHLSCNFARRRNVSAVHRLFQTVRARKPARVYVNHGQSFRLFYDEICAVFKVYPRRSQGGNLFRQPVFLKHIPARIVQKHGTAVFGGVEIDKLAYQRRKLLRADYYALYVVT